MNMKKTTVGITLLILMLAVFCLQGCGQSADGLKDGYYTAEMSEFNDYNHGWKEYITISVTGGNVVSVEYNARNASGFIKSWDMSYMRIMDMVEGTYPNRYTRAYAAQILKDQNADSIDLVSGASHSFETFSMLAEAVLQQARTGDTSLAIVPSPTK